MPLIHYTTMFQPTPTPSQEEIHECNLCAGEPLCICAFAPLREKYKV
jgi:hypothetical protein